MQEPPRTRDLKWNVNIATPHVERGLHRSRETEIPNTLGIHSEPPAQDSDDDDDHGFRVGIREGTWLSRRTSAGPNEVVLPKGKSAPPS